MKNAECGMRSAESFVHTSLDMRSCILHENLQRQVQVRLGARFRTPHSAFRILFSLALLALLSGCACEKPCEPPSQPLSYYLSSQADLMRIQSVAFVELDSPLADVPRAKEASESLYEDLQQRNLFNVEYVQRKDFRCRELPLDVNEPLELRQLDQIRKALGCDAVVLGEMYHFQQYPRTKVALQLKMIDLKNGRLVWGVKHTWDGTDKEVAHRIHEYWEDQVRKGFEPADEDLVQMSPRWFLKFVSWESVGTLPTRDTLGQPPAKKTAMQTMKKQAADGARKVVELAKED